jgi:pimeloyl-ACP methyl ester carboxylesterase
VTEPQWLDVTTPTVQVCALTWGPAGTGCRRPDCPTLYLHGTDDGCAEDDTPWIERVLPDESELALVENGGHFLQLDQPDVVARHIVDFVGQAS